MHAIDTTLTRLPLDKSSSSRRIHDITWERVADGAGQARRPIADHLDVLVHEALVARGEPGLFTEGQPR